MFVKNAIVKMDWVVEGFIETKKGGFVAAIHDYQTDYGTVPVVFMNGHAFCVWDEDEQRLSNMEEIKSVLKQCYDGGLDFEETLTEQDAYVLVTDLSITNDYVKMEYKLSDEDLEDIENRIFDLKGYESEEVLEI